MLRELNRARAAVPPAGGARGPRAWTAARAATRATWPRRGYFAHGRWTGRVVAAARSARSVGEVIGWRVQGSPRSEGGDGSSAHGSAPRPTATVAARAAASAASASAARPAHSDGRPTALYTVDFASASGRRETRVAVSPAIRCDSA